MSKKFEYFITNFKKNTFLIDGFLIKVGKTEIDKDLYESFKSKENSKKHSLIKELIDKNLIILIKRKKCL